MYRVLQISVCVFILLISSAANVFSAKTEDLKQLSLEELFALEVTTASRKPQPFIQSASAIDVITQDRIKQSGATTLPDLLRLAAGVHVARFNSGSWAVGARGLNLTTSNRMQILMDGRVLYSPLFSGVLWDAQDYILEDIDRIEIVRGPGAVAWGANAMNGVINIITKKSRDTQGSFLEAGAGNEEQGFASYRYGKSYNHNTGHYRGYFKFFNRDGLVTSAGNDAHEDSLMGRAGFRVDHTLDLNNQLTFEGDLYRGEFEFPDRDNSKIRGGHFIGRWNHEFSKVSDLQVSGYFERTSREVPLQFAEDRNTYNLDLVHRFRRWPRHDLVSGMNYRASDDSTSENGTIRFDPPERTLHLLSAFVQDEIAIIPNRLGLIAGSKFEYYSLTGFELQPNLRLIWNPKTDHIIWTAISRAVRAPARIDTDFQFFPIPGFLALTGNPNFDPEELISFEGGYKTRLMQDLYLDLSAFYGNYDSLISIRPREGLPAIISNDYDAIVRGFTTQAIYELDPFSKIVGTITFLSKSLELEPGTIDISNAAGEGNDPDFYWTLQGYFNLMQDVTFAAILRSSDELPSPFVPGYITLDLRLAWNAAKQLEFSIVGQNLFQESHPEIGPDTPERREIERSVYGRIAWKF